MSFAVDTYSTALCAGLEVKTPIVGARIGEVLGVAMGGFACIIRRSDGKQVWMKTHRVRLDEPRGK